MEFNPLEAILLLLATIGPLKVVIVNASLTSGCSPEFVRRLAFRAVLIATVVCVLFAVLGEVILKVFKVSIPAFQIAGGIITLLFSLEMVTGHESEKAPSDPGAGDAGKVAEPSLDLAVYPLAVPLMASVSGLVAIVSLLAQRDDLKAVLFLVGVIVAIMALDYVCLCSCQVVVRAIGPTAIQVTGKIMGVILTALAVEMILMGLIGLGIIAKPPGFKDSAPKPAAEAREANHPTVRRRPGVSGVPIGETVSAVPIRERGDALSSPDDRLAPPSPRVEWSGAVIRGWRPACEFPAILSMDRERARCVPWPGSPRMAPEA